MPPFKQKFQTQNIHPVFVCLFLLTSFFKDFISCFRPYPYSRYTTYRPVLKMLNCTGSENTIQECSGFRLQNVTTCSWFATVVCYNDQRKSNQWTALSKLTYSNCSFDALRSFKVWLFNVSECNKLGKE